jgi:hypothetical protein
VKESAGGTAWRVALFTLIVASIFWLGSGTVRLLMGSDLLQSGTLEFEPYLSPDSEREIYRLLSMASLLQIPAYVITIVSSVAFLAWSPYRLKDHGWLLAGAILLYVFVPVEAFVMTLDGRMVYLEFFTTADRMAFRELFLARAGALGGVPFVAQLCYYTIVGLAVFQPFRRAGGGGT